MLACVNLQGKNIVTDYCRSSVLKVWTIDGECVQELYGHTSFVYSVTVLSTGELVSCGEDRTVRVWKGIY